MNLSPAQMTEKLNSQQLIIEELRTNQRRLQESVSNLGEAVAAPPSTPTPEGQIDNLLRNSKLRHSWDSWTNSTPVAGNQQEECAHVYVHTPDTAIEARGAIAAGTDGLFIDDTFFLEEHAGDDIIVEGAGADGADLITTIQTYENSQSATLADEAETTVENARVRWRLQTLELTSTKTGSAGVNAALKNEDHSAFDADGNITDPRWNKEAGYAELGAKNTIDFPLGFWNKDVNAFVFQKLLEAGKTYYFICKIARKNQFIKPRGYFFLKLWDNSENRRQVIEGGRFTLEAVPVGTPQAVVSSSYKVIARTDQGLTLESNVVTVNRPAPGAFVTDQIYELLRWTFLPGIRIFEIYRKTGATVEKLAEITNSQNLYLDQNAVQPGVIGSFPIGDTQRARAEELTPPNALDEINVNGAGAGWSFIRFRSLRVPDEYLTGGATEQWARAGLTEDCDREMTDASTTAGSSVVESATAAFEAEDEGLDVEIVSGNNVFAGTIANVISPTTAEVSAPVSFDAENATITIIGGGRGGLLVSEFGLSLTPGAWAANHDDNQTAQTPPANPVPTGENNPTYDGTLCVRRDSRVELFNPEKKIEELPIRYTQVGNKVESGNLKPNIVLKKIVGRSRELLEIRAGGRTLFCTPNHPLFRDFHDFDRTTPARDFKVGDLVAQKIDGRSTLNPIEHIELHVCEPEEAGFEVENYELWPGHIYVVEGFYSHNRKNNNGGIEAF